jgi:hypothetical protein
LLAHDVHCNELDATAICFGRSPTDRNDGVFVANTDDDRG